MSWQNIEHRIWDTKLFYATFAYNTALQDTTDFTYFRLVHGREDMKAVDAMLLHHPGHDKGDNDPA